MHVWVGMFVPEGEMLWVGVHMYIEARGQTYFLKQDLSLGLGT